MDPITIIGTALVGGKVIEKILGPTADYVGEGLKTWTQIRKDNVQRIFNNATLKIGNDIDKPEGVSPKILKGILEDGSWCEEEIQIEYFGGVLASSRSKNQRDDRGVYFMNILSRLTIYQLRFHYIVFSHIRNHFKGEQINFYDATTWENLEIFIPDPNFELAMDFNDDEKESDNILGHCLIGLHKEDLLSNLSAGNKEKIQKDYKSAECGGILVQPSVLGVELFMWAIGKGKSNPTEFLSESMTFNVNDKFNLGSSIRTKIKP